MERRPKIFIGSASETTKIADAIRETLEPHMEVHHWAEVFGLGEYNLQALQRQAAECDFAVFVWGTEDTILSRKEETGGPRDNVVYEAGLFAGALGEYRVFVVHAKGTKIPSDYLGVTTETVDLRSPDTKTIADRIRSRVAYLGPKPARRMEGYWWQIVLTKDRSAVVSFVRVRPELDGRSVSLGGHAWNQAGRLMGRWDSIATQFDEGTETLHYSWQGPHIRDPGIPVYFGVGKIRYGLRPIVGDYSSTERHAGKEPEPTRHKSALYIPAEPGDIEVMRGNDAPARKKLLESILKKRKSFE